jgi:hypothetical protein
MVVRPGENPHHITVTAETMKLIEDAVLPGYTFRMTGTLRADGRYDIMVGDEVYDRLITLLETTGHLGDDIDSIINRALREALGRKPS